jgi:hypothetical protein
MLARRMLARRALVPLALGLACAGLCWCYLRLSATFPAGADGASNALEAWDLLHGNWLLRGWTLTDVSFYTTELPEYAAIELARGLSPGVLRIAAAVTYTLLVAASALLARGRPRDTGGCDTGGRDTGSRDTGSRDTGSRDTRSRDTRSRDTGSRDTRSRDTRSRDTRSRDTRSRDTRSWARALIAAAVLLAPQLGSGVHVLLAQPDHTGTQVLILGILLVLEHAPRRWYTACGLWALLTVAIVADKIVIVDAVVPLAFVGLLHALWTRRPLSHRFELSLAAAAGASVGAAALLLTLIGRAGGFTLLPVRTGLTTPGTVPGHLSLAWHGVLSLFGADVTAAAPGPQAVLALLHAPGIALAAAAFAVTAWRVPNQRDLVGDVLAVGIVVNLAGFVASVIPATPFDTREVAALLPFGAVLAGRVFGARTAPAPPPTSTTPADQASNTRTAPAPPPTSTTPADQASDARTALAVTARRGEAARPAAGGRSRLRPPGTGRRRPGPARSWGPAAALAIAGACQLAALGYGAAQPAAGDPEQALAGWLAARHLTSGLGTFNEGNLTTLDSGGRVRLLAVSWLPPAPAARRSYQPDLRTGQAAELQRPGGAVARLYQSSASWYDARDHYADFVVTGTADGTADLIPREEVLALAGVPARTYQFQSFTIMVWNVNLLTLLGGPPSRLPGVIGHP